MPIMYMMVIKYLNYQIVFNISILFALALEAHAIDSKAFLHNFSNSITV
jgi:hypothetical protein